MKFCFAVAMGLAASVYAADACTAEDMVRLDAGHLIAENKSDSISGTPWSFEVWSQDADPEGNSMTYYDNGTFKAEWYGSPDFWARIGYRYWDSPKGVAHTDWNYSLDYKYTKTIGHGEYLIGVHGWLTEPYGEFFIVDDWNYPIQVAKTFGEYEVDGAKYTVRVALIQNGETWQGWTQSLLFYSIRETPRECGHIDVSAHFRKFDELFAGQADSVPDGKGINKRVVLKFGKLSDVMVAVNAFVDATGSIDYTYLSFGAERAEVQSSSSANPESSSSSGQVESSSSESPLEILAVSSTLRAMSGAFQVLDMQGRYLGKVEMLSGADIEGILFAKFHKAGIYLVKQGAVLKRVRVNGYK